jgi:hypothetical protein
LGLSEAVARARQRPGEIPALWHRIATSVALVAAPGWAAGRFIGAGPVPVAMVTGALGGVLGIRPQKVVLGPLLGAERVQAKDLPFVVPREARSARRAPRYPRAHRHDHPGRQQRRDRARLDPVLRGHR